jgi:hypothetical protein
MERELKSILAHPQFFKKQLMAEKNPEEREGVPMGFGLEEFRSSS